MFSRRSMLVLVAALALMVGCVNYDERLELNADGSGVIRVHLSINEQLIPPDALPPMKTLKEDDLLPVPRQEIVSGLEADGFKVKSLRAESIDGFRHFYIVLEFKSVDQLAKSSFFNGRKIVFTREGDTFRFSQEIDVSERSLTEKAEPPKKAPAKKDDKGGKSGKPEEKKPAQAPSKTGEAAKPPQKPGGFVQQLEEQFGKEQVRRMFASQHVVFSVSVAGTGIVETDGTGHRGVTSVWDYPLNQIIDRKAPLAMKAVFSTAGAAGN